MDLANDLFKSACALNRVMAQAVENIEAVARKEERAKIEKENQNGKA
jgi:hypothetical protein